MVHRRDRVHSCHRAPVILGPVELRYLAAIGSTVRTAVANGLRESTTLGYSTQSGWQRVLVSSDLPVVHEEGVEEGTWKNRERRGVEGIQAGVRTSSCGKRGRVKARETALDLSVGRIPQRSEKIDPRHLRHLEVFGRRWESYRFERGFFTLAFPVSTVCLGPDE